METVKGKVEANFDIEITRERVVTDLCNFTKGEVYNYEEKDGKYFVDGKCFSLQEVNQFFTRVK